MESAVSNSEIFPCSCDFPGQREGAPRSLEVYAGDHRAIALGTAFEVRLEPDMRAVRVTPTRREPGRQKKFDDGEGI